MKKMGRPPLPKGGKKIRQTVLLSEKQANFYRSVDRKEGGRGKVATGIRIVGEFWEPMV